MRIAISPRFAIRTFSNTAGEYCVAPTRPLSSGAPLDLALLAGSSLVLATAADAAVLALAAHQLVLATAAADPIPACQSDDHVPTAETGNDVRASRAVDLVRAVIADLRDPAAAAGLYRLPAWIHFPASRERDVRDVVSSGAVRVHHEHVRRWARIDVEGDLAAVRRVGRVGL